MTLTPSQNNYYRSKQFQFFTNKVPSTEIFISCNEFKYFVHILVDTVMNILMNKFIGK